MHHKVAAALDAYLRRLLLAVRSYAFGYLRHDEIIVRPLEHLAREQQVDDPLLYEINCSKESLVECRLPVPLRSRLVGLAVWPSRRGLFRQRQRQRQRRRVFVSVSRTRRILMTRAVYRRDGARTGPTSFRDCRLQAASTVGRSNAQHTAPKPSPWRQCCVRTDAFKHRPAVGLLVYVWRYARNTTRIS
jgi:hypothetical protein